MRKSLLNDDGAAFLKRLGNLRDVPLISVVFNFVDMLSHQRSESHILREIAPDEAAFRSLTRSWFEHSVLLDILREAAADGATVIMTTDHGSVMGEKRALSGATGPPRQMSGTSMAGTSKPILQKFWLLMLPNPSGCHRLWTTYSFARNEYYLVYPNNFRSFQKLFQNTLQHGGISMEEYAILPVGIMKPR